jgi:gustatory receptor
MVLKACEACLEEVRYIGFYLHDIEKDIDDEGMNALNENFSLQILHEPFAFSVMGFFQMDFMFLKTFIASITTYMVIFIQFMPKIDEHAADNSTTTTTTTALTVIS